MNRLAEELPALTRPALSELSHSRVLLVEEVSPYHRIGSWSLPAASRAIHAAKEGLEPPPSG